MIKDYTDIHQSYTLMEQTYIDEAKSYGALLKHNKTGAMVVVLSNEDKNKVFDIAFRTPPKDSTGVAHILEHSVLCGSKAFPVKDPFVELVKGSLNTFLNAMTYPDKTMYPVASCNDKDFQNLMHVYLDSVFYPNIYKYKEIFLQEGWHYALDDADSELTINGVVYNEMKGAFSAPDQVLSRKIISTLFPDVTYGQESGGDPEAIPTLTYEGFLDFHKTYYHPSNAFIYLYGDMDVYEKLEFIHKAYLNDFDYLEVDSEIPLQAAFKQMIEVEDTYSIGSTEDENDNTFFAYNVVLKDTMDPELYLAISVLDYALMSCPGAPLKMALIDAGIGKDVYSEYERCVRQPYFSIVAKNCNVSDKERFMSVIRSALNNIIENGLDTDAIKASLNRMEFKFREGDYGWAPAGLMYGIQMMDSWLYNKEKPFVHLCCYKTFEILRERIGTGYYEELIRTYFLENNHASLLTLKPEQGKAAKEEQALAQYLAEYKASLTVEEIQSIIDEAKQLEEYQETPSTQEELMSIPMLTLEDIEKESTPFSNEEISPAGFKGVLHDYETHGIGYVKLLFDMTGMPNSLIPYASLLTNILGNVNTKTKSYQTLNNEMDMHTGGVYTNLLMIGAPNDGYIPFFEVTGKAMYSEIETMISLIKEMLFDSVLQDSKRIKEVIDEQISRIQMMMSSSGHSVAVSRATSYFSESAKYREMTHGLDYYRFLQDLAKNYNDTIGEIIKGLEEASKFIFRKDNIFIDYTSKKENLEVLENALNGFDIELNTDQVIKEDYNFHPDSINEGLITAGMVCYDVLAGDYKKAGYEYHGGLNVLKVIMGYEYLWTNIRVKGGAYGCMCGFNRNGQAYFASYRDPNLKETLDVYKKCSEYLKTFDVSDRDMLKYIIGAISDIDAPKSPSVLGVRSLGAYFSGITVDDLQKSRDELISTDVNTIRGFAGLIDAFVSQNHLCVVGSENQIEKNKDLFNHIEVL